MIGLRKILVKSFFLLAVSLCLGINTYSYYNYPYFNNETLTCNSNVENSFSPNIDSLSQDQIDQSDLNEDQINQLNYSDLSPESFSLIRLRQAYFPIHILCFSIWQPPKIS